MRAVRFFRAISAAGIWLLGCQHGNNVAGPAATPTPLPSLSGNWTGTASALYILKCGNDSSTTGPATADLVETGSAVSGTIDAQFGACSLAVTVQLTRVGLGVNGTAAQGDFKGDVTGTFIEPDLRLSVGNLFNPEGNVLLGASLDLHR